MNLYSLRALSAVHRFGSITQAARHLRLSQPAVTRAIRHLEQELGFTLLAHQSRSLSFTPRGEALLKHAQLIAELEQEASRELLERIRSRPSEVRLAASDVPAAVVLPAALRLLHAASPEVRVRIIEASPDLQHYFRKDLIDLAIAPVPASDQADRYRIEPLLDVPMVVAVGKGRGLQHVRSLGELTQVGWAVDKSMDASRDVLAEVFGAAGLNPPRKALTCESVTTTIHFIESEGFAGLVPQQLALEAFQAGRIDLLSIQEPLPRRTIGVFYPLSGGLTAASQALFSMLRLAARSHMSANNGSQPTNGPST